MSWSDEAEQILTAFTRMVPESVRSLAEASARAESEIAAGERQSSEVEPADVVRGWIRTTPPEQRDALVVVIEDLGFQPELFAEDLESPSGWGEGEQAE